jgi:opacity protein-like surface antigen
MKKSLVAAAAALAMASGAMTIPASAADLEFMPPPPVFQPVWSGFYVGGHVGYGEADADAEIDLDYIDGPQPLTESDSYSFSESLSSDGLIGGVQGGYNWQFNSLVFGIEGDISFTDWGQKSVVFDRSDVLDLGFSGLDPDEDAFGNASVEIDFLASVRGRLGMAFNNFLVYGTGGVAWAEAEARARVEVDDNALAQTTEWTGKESFDDIGFVVGGGMGWMVIPQTFSVGIEGLYYFFDDSTTLISDTIDYDDGELDVKATATLDDAWVVRVRGDFHF